MIIDTIGYISNAILLISSMQTKMMKLRILCLIGTLLYLLYGILLNANPIIISSIIYIMIHSYNIYKIIKEERTGVWKQ